MSDIGAHAGARPDDPDSGYRPGVIRPTAGMVEIYRDLRRFLAVASAAGAVPRAPDIGAHPIVRVPLRAGEIVIWKSTLLHGNGRNTSERVRLAQYVSMNPPPADPDAREAQRTRRVAAWEASTHPDGDPFPGDPRRIEEERGERAQLSPLGRRLLGLVP